KKIMEVDAKVKKEQETVGEKKDLKKQRVLAKQPGCQGKQMEDKKQLDEEKKEE
ncbi:hypothetical protein H2248_008212, partial [Termitomyces sp. 'cryptogamus']